MKKITLLASLTALAAFGQQPTTASEHVQINLDNTQLQTASIRSHTSAARVQTENITLFETREAFLDNCADGEFLTFEDFEGFTGGPNDSVEACSTIIDSSGDNCFLEGEIQEGVSFTSSAGNMVFFNEGSFGVENPGVGADVFTSFTIINFTAATPVTSVGFDLYSPLGDGGPIEARVFGETGLIEAVTFDVGSTAFFVGIVADEPIVQIELENPEGVIIELVTQFYFGNCEALNIEENTFGNFNFFPNPTQNEVTISSTIAVEKISIYNLLGQKVKSQTINSTTSNIDVSNLKTGVYILEVASNDQIGTFKMIKE